jgi:hypothetical protein
MGVSKLATRIFIPDNTEATLQTMIAVSLSNGAKNILAR